MKVELLGILVEFVKEMEEMVEIKWFRRFVGEII